MILLRRAAGILFLAFLMPASAAHAQSSTVASQDSETGVQPKEALEYDYCGNLVPASVPHMYRYAFRLVDSITKQGEQQGKSYRSSLRYSLGMSDSDFTLFEESATRFASDDAAFDKQIAALKQTDRAEHPELHGALSESARKSVHAILAKQEADLVEEVHSFRNRFAPDHAKALDKKITERYIQTLFVPPSAPRASVPCVPPEDTAAKSSS
jgi:hypothetical protein